MKLCKAHRGIIDGTGECPYCEILRLNSEIEQLKEDVSVKPEDYQRVCWEVAELRAQINWYNGGKGRSIAGMA